MSRLNDLLHNTQAGLLPYLQAKIAADFNHLIVRQYSFGSTSQRTGYRVRSVRTIARPDRTHERTVSVAIGKLLDITTDQDYQIVAADFANALGDAITHWSLCNAAGLKESITEIDANLAPVQNPNVTGGSSSPAAWAIAIVLSFQVTYWD